MKTRFLTMIMIATALGFAGCEEETDDTDNGVPANTLIVSGTSITMSSVVCGETGSGDDLTLTVSDIAMDNLLYIRFGNQRPTVTTTIPLSPSGSSSQAWGDFTVNGNIVYEIQSGTATLTPQSNGKLTITFNDVVAETNNDVQVTLSFNGTCD